MITTSLVYFLPSLYGLAVSEWHMAFLCAITCVGSSLYHRTRESAYFNLDNIFVPTSFLLLESLPCVRHLRDLRHLRISGNLCRHFPASALRPTCRYFYHKKHIAGTTMLYPIRSTLIQFGPRVVACSQWMWPSTVRLDVF